MAGIHNFQRRALELLMQERPEKTTQVGGSRRYFFHGREIFLWGISKGIGTCSDLHGIDIAVFGEERSTAKIPETSCRSLALVRLPLSGECPEDGVARKVVEGLAVHTITGDEMVLVRTGRKEAYANTIC